MLVRWLLLVALDGTSWLLSTFCFVLCCFHVFVLNNIGFDRFWVIGFVTIIPDSYCERESTTTLLLITQTPHGPTSFLYVEWEILSGLYFFFDLTFQVSALMVVTDLADGKEIRPKLPGPRAN